MHYTKMESKLLMLSALLLIGGKFLDTRATNVAGKQTFESDSNGFIGYLEAPPLTQTLATPVQVSANTSSESSSIVPSIKRHDLLDAAPTITSVHHQVWTSSSSGSLDELSPELIGKLRHDVPFLAAYALRPRLVGGGTPMASTSFVSNAYSDHKTPESQLGTTASVGSHRVATNSASPLETGASSLQARTASNLSGQLRLDNLSELNIETDSTSKSVHHHRRKTSFKRRPNDDYGLARSDINYPSSKLDRSSARSRRTLLAEASRLIKQRRLRRGRQKQSKIQGKEGLNGSTKTRSNMIGGKSKDRSKIKRSKSASTTTKRDRRRRRNNRFKESHKGSLQSTQRSHLARVGQLRRKMNQRNLKHHMDIIKHGQYLQSDPSHSQDNGVELKMNEIGVEKTTMTLVEPRVDENVAGSGTTPDGDIKGGVSRANGVPFYASQRPTALGDQKTGKTEDKPAMIGPMDGANKEGRSDNGPANSIGDEESAEEDEALDDEPHGEPKRVGDADVEEEGDTVMVEPKFDGVDDDPPIPQNEDEEDATNEVDGHQDKGAGGEREGDSKSTKTTPGLRGFDGGSTKMVAEGDERGNRVNRHRPNTVDDGRPMNDEIGDGSETEGGGSQTLGGGIGATVGGAPVANPALGSGNNSGEQESGVEFANDGNEGGHHDYDDIEEDVRQPKPVHGNGHRDRDDNDGSVSEMRETDATSVQEPGGFGRRQKQPNASSEPDKRVADGGTDDLDYRNDNDDDDYLDNDSDRDKSKENRAKSASSSNDVSGKDEEERKTIRKSQRGPDDDNVIAVSRNKLPDEQKRPKIEDQDGTNCQDDGSYKHHDESYHDAHHQTKDWLRGSIPGEPSDDYPILSRTNESTFTCGEQKYPGYYADVKSRCQVFHICQMNGRQDSFLCPNGTIFSQKAFVCVWWNGFDCEDAPKYYHLNSLLYKTMPSRDCDHNTANNEDHESTINSANGDDNKILPLPDGVRELKPLDNGVSRFSPKGSTLNGMSDARKLDNGDLDEDKITGTQVSKDKDETSIDDLIRAMKERNSRRRADRGHEGKIESNDDDESTIQRKPSTTVQANNSEVGEDSSSLPSEVARLRNRVKSAPRRKRRASMRQAPPKLKSRRVSRNSRRRKLRHGIKPKRRA